MSSLSFSTPSPPSDDQFQWEDEDGLTDPWLDCDYDQALAVESLTENNNGPSQAETTSAASVNPSVTSLEVEGTAAAAPIRPVPTSWDRDRFSCGTDHSYVDYSMHDVDSDTWPSEAQAVAPSINPATAAAAAPVRPEPTNRDLERARLTAPSRRTDHRYTDYSRHTVDSQLYPVTKKWCASFPAKLHRLISDLRSREAIQWQPHGRGK